MVTYRIVESKSNITKRLAIINTMIKINTHSNNPDYNEGLFEELDDLRDKKQKLEQKLKIN